MELKHLAAYLPYNIEIYDIVHKFSFNLSEKWANELPLEFQEAFGKNLFTQVLIDKTLKPILRPLSDLTKEIEENGEKFVPTEWLQNRYELLNLHEQAEQLSKDHRWLNQSDYMLVMHLIEWKFDVFGLIEKGEAIDINTLDL